MPPALVQFNGRRQPAAEVVIVVVVAADEIRSVQLLPVVAVVSARPSDRPNTSSLITAAGDTNIGQLVSTSPVGRRRPGDTDYGSVMEFVVGSIGIDNGWKGSVATAVR